MSDANECFVTRATSLVEKFSSGVFDNILAQFNFLCLSFGSGNKTVWMRILRVSREERKNHRELIK